MLQEVKVSFFVCSRGTRAYRQTEETCRNVGRIEGNAWK